MKVAEFSRRSALKWLILPLLVAVVLVWAVVLTLPDDKLHVSFLDVGQGDAILVQTPNHQNILIDGGPSPKALNLELGERLSFWDRTIDLVVSTQPQVDHLAGLVEVLKRYEVKQVVESGISYNTTVYQEWNSSVNESGARRDRATAGQEVDLGGGIKLEVLGPPEELFQGTSDDVDNNGVVLRLEWGEVSFLFTADIRWDGEFELIKERPGLQSTVLKVAHHGSNSSTTGQFLAVVDPQAAVIPVGNNTFGHPRNETVERLEEKVGKEKVYRTDEDGTVEFITDGERLWVRVGKTPS